MASRGIHFLGEVSAALARVIGNHQLCVLTLPTIYFFVRHPPFWNGTDVVGQLLLPASSINILHYPPIYSFLARIPFWITDYALRGRGPTIFSTQYPSLSAIYLLVGCQHVALWFSLRYFLFSIPTTAFRRGLVALLLASNSGFYSIAHTCGSEALLPVSWFTVFGSGMRMLQLGVVHWTWIIYSAALLLGIGSRHINGVLLVWLPTLCVMLVAGRKLGRVVSAKRLGQGSTRRADPTGNSAGNSNDWVFILSNLTQSSVNLGKIAVLALISGAGVFGAEKVIVDVLCQRFQVIPRSTLGATLSDRISSIVEGLSDHGKAKLSARVESLTSDSLVKLSITSQIYLSSYYGGTNDVITSTLVERGMRGEELFAARDRIILRSSSCFYRVVPSRLLKVMGKDSLRAFLRTSDTNIALVGPQGNLYAARSARKQPAFWIPLRGIPMIELSTASSMLRTANSDIFLRKWRRISILTWCLIFLTISVMRLGRESLSPDFFMVGLSILGMGAVSCLAYFVCVFYSPRYVLPLMVSVMACGSVLSGATVSGETVRSEG